MHSRSTAAALIFTRELVPHLLAHAEADRAGVEKTVEALTEDHYFFLRLSMAAGKVIADAAHGIEAEVGIDQPWEREALQWALARGNRSGRTAEQFARDWAGRFSADDAL